MRTFLFIISLLYSFCTVAQTQQVICSGQSIPNGWVKLREDYSAGCPPSNKSITIYKLDGLPAGSYANICDEQSYPDGWVKVSQQSCNFCGQSPYNLKPRWQITIRKLEGMAPGTSANICGNQTIPNGWVKLSEQACNFCGLNSPDLTPAKLFTIYKLDGLPVGSYANICNEQLYPNGWVKVDQRNCNYCGQSPYNLKPVDEITIHKIGAAREATVSNSKIENATKIYPNPVRNTINVPLNELDNNCQFYSITDANGRIVSQAKSLDTLSHDNLAVDVSGLQTGLYLIRIGNAKSIITYKFIVE